MYVAEGSEEERPACVVRDTHSQVNELDGVPEEQPAGESARTDVGCLEKPHFCAARGQQV